MLDRAEAIAVGPRNVLSEQLADIVAVAGHQPMLVRFDRG
jgi:hypothetical protein